jgi:energy-coupling factor transporter transmembrane protein EcfT
LSKVIAGTFSILSDCALIAPCHALFAFFQIVLSLQVQVMAKEVWVFGTKEQVFTQAYKIENSWTIKHYLIDSGRGFETKISKGLSANKKKAMQQKKQYNYHFFHKVLVCNISSAIIYAASISLQSFFCIISDSGRGFETKISKGLSANKKKAMQQIKQRFARHKDQWVANAKRAWQGAI